LADGRDPLDNIINQDNNTPMHGTRILDYIYAAHRYLAELESVPREYGSGEKLFASEIHTVAAVYRDPGCNLTVLAATLDVSPAAASKFVAKLIRRGYIVKYKAPDNRRDVLFEATEKGRIAAKGHERFEKRTFAKLIRAEQSLEPREREVVRGYFEKLMELVK